MKGNNAHGNDWPRILKLLVALVISLFIGVRFQPMVANNANAVNTVVTIFSILAGFLIAVITFIAEPTLRQAKNWQELQLMKKTIQRRLLRQKILFFLYLLTLGVALTMFLTPKTMTQFLVVLETLFLGLAAFVFIASFSLPGSLTRFQMDRYEAALENAKPQALKDAKHKAAKLSNDT